MGRVIVNLKIKNFWVSDMNPRKFVKNNCGFICKVCSVQVPPHPSSSRDHCNNCLYSTHVDVNPGDRENPCHGLLEPVGIDLKKGEKCILYKCKECRKRVVNTVAPDDSQDEIVKLSAFHS